MIMTIDVGNTNITVGVFRGDEVVSNFRITTKMPRTSDEYGMLLSNLLEQNSISHDDIEDAIIASVVPNVMHSLEGAIIKYFSIRPIIVEPGTKTGIRVVTENPRQIGADRIVSEAHAGDNSGKGAYISRSCTHLRFPGSHRRSPAGQQTLRPFRRADQAAR